MKKSLKKLAKHIATQISDKQIIIDDIEQSKVDLSKVDKFMPKITTSKTSKLAGIAAAVLASAVVAGTVGMSSAQANVNNSQVTAYASAMNSAANAKNIQSIARLIADDAVISITRNNKTWTVGKADYLKLLQENWQSSNNYSYSIDVTDIVTTGRNAKANVRTVERMVKNGQPVTFITESRATLTEGQGGALLLRSVSQITVK